MSRSPVSGFSLRDRFFTPPVARAVTSPTGLVALGLGAVVGWAAAGPAGAAAMGLLAWAARVAAAIPRAPRQPRIDPFAVSEPWRHFVKDALQAQSRFREAVSSSADGPLRDRLTAIQERVDSGVGDVWRIARRGHDLVAARRRIDPSGVQAQLASTTGTTDDSAPALQAQLASVERLDRVIRDADRRLRLLNVRLDEAAARTIELSVGGDDMAALGGLGTDVDRVVDEMEALRLAIEETGGGAASGSAG